MSLCQEDVPPLNRAAYVDLPAILGRRDIKELRWGCSMLASIRFGRGKTVQEAIDAPGTPKTPSAHVANPGMPRHSGQAGLEG